MAGTSRDRQELREKADQYFAEGKTISEVSEALGISATCIRSWGRDGMLQNWAPKATNARRALTEEAKRKAQELLDSGMSCNAVSKAVGVSSAVLTGAVRRGELTGIVRRIGPDEDMAKAQELISGGMTTKAAAQALGMSYATLASWIVKGLVRKDYVSALEIRRATKLEETRKAMMDAYHKDGPFESIAAWARAAGVPRHRAEDLWKSDVDIPRKFKSPVPLDSVVYEESAIHNERDLNMVQMRNAGKTLQEIADVYRISRERVRQILNRIELASARIKSSDNPA